MNLVFMGTPDFSVAVLAALIDAGHAIICVYTQPPRPAGRGQNVKPSPIQIYAEAKGIPVRAPLSLKTSTEQDAFAALHADAAVVVAYGLLLPTPILQAPRFGCFNVHASLLPRWRGAAPLQRAIMAGDTKTGVTIMRMEEGLDTGPMLASETITITPETTVATLHDQLAKMGGPLMASVLETPEAAGTPQPSDGVTYAKKIDKAEAVIDFNQPASNVVRHIHGLSPFPGAWFMIKNARVKVLAAAVESREGAALTFLDDALLVACGAGSVRLLKLQREGKAPMNAATFLRGFPIPAGERLT